MNLGEKIYQLRTSKNLSQGDLAEMLEVSRQSISKWENNSAVPDLDKIVKLSEIFGVSLDELVKGEQAPKASEHIRAFEPDSNSVETVIVKPATQTKTIVGILMICLSVAVVLIAPILLIFVIPLIICGIICLVCKKHVGLKCAWTIYFYLDVYMRYATGINWSVVRYTFSWTQDMNYMRLGFGWILFLARIIMVVATVMILRKDDVGTERKIRNRTLLYWGVVVGITVLLGAGGLGYSYMTTNMLSYMIPYVRVYSIVIGILDCCRFGFFAAAVLNTIRYISCKRRNSTPNH